MCDDSHTDFLHAKSPIIINMQATSGENQSSGFLTRSDTNWAVQSRGLKFQIYEVEACSENKGADQLRGYGAADPCLCFHKCKKQVFS